MGLSIFTPRPPGSLKLCKDCARELPLSAFAKHSASKDRLQLWCRECNRKRYIAGKLGIDGDEDTKLVSTASTLYGKPAGIPAHILNGIIVPPTTVSPCHGVWMWRTPKNWCVLAIHYSADPRKRPGTPEGDAWIAQEKAKSSVRDWQREMEIDNTISEGDPFFPSFNRAIHIKPCTFNPEWPLLVALDFGRGHPAALWAQKTPTNQIRVLSSLMETQKSIFDFAPQILAETNARYPGANVQYFGDPAGAQETDKGATTQILLNEFKMRIHYRFSFLEEGLKMLERSLMVRADGEPGLIFDPSNLILIDGFAGGYKIDTGASGKDGQGRLKNAPKKDGWYDHLIDGLRYLFINIFTIAPTKDTDDKALSAVSLWMTNSERRKREEEDTSSVGDFFT